MPSKLRVDKSTTPIGIPASVVATIPIKIAPRTFRITNTAVNNNPKTANKTLGSVKVEIAGTTPPFALIENTPSANVLAVALAGSTPFTVTILAAEAEKVMMFAFLNPK
ncbi:Uncharacterised protein [Chlamydia trachomatis]|nr:Uncharacterised protein [Chlamydia trachomatis]